MPAMPLTAWATSDRVGDRRTGTVGNPGWAARATSTACATSSVGTGPTEVARPNGSSDAAIRPLAIGARDDHANLHRDRGVGQSVGVAATPLTWIYRALWFVLPFTIGELVGDALSDHSSAVAWCGAVLGWLAWATALGTSMMPAPASLTVVRILAPTPLVAGVVAAVVLAPDAAPGALGWVGLVSAAVALVCAVAPEVGEWFVNGASYGDERRMPIRPPCRCCSVRSSWCGPSQSSPSPSARCWWQLATGCWVRWSSRSVSSRRSSASASCAGSPTGGSCSSPPASRSSTTSR